MCVITELLPTLITLADGSWTSFLWFHRHRKAPSGWNQTLTTLKNLNLYLIYYLIHTTFFIVGSDVTDWGKICVSWVCAKYWHILFGWENVRVLLSTCRLLHARVYIIEYAPIEYCIHVGIALSVFCDACILNNWVEWNHTWSPFSPTFGQLSFPQCALLNTHCTDALASGVYITGYVPKKYCTLVHIGIALCVFSFNQLLN